MGRNCKDGILRRPLILSNSGDDNNSSDVPLLSLWRGPDDGGTPIPRRFSDNETRINRYLLVLAY